MEARTKVIEVRYATSRAPIYKNNALIGYGVKRLISPYPDTGIVRVSIPISVHREGVIERPWLNYFASDDEHFVLKNIMKQQKENFYQQLKAQLSITYNGAAFIYVHGYNVSFEDAALRTAQIAYDLGGIASPVFFSWPSLAKPVPYTVDENNSEWTYIHLKAFLTDFASRTEARKIVVLAHSMGSRPVSRALSKII